MKRPIREKASFLQALGHFFLSLAALLTGLILSVLVFILSIYTLIAIKGNALTIPRGGLPAKVDCIIVPGAQIYANRTPSPMLQDRLDGAVYLYRAGVSDRILVSGDHREDNYNEPLVMYRYLLNQGIPDEVIFMDHYGLDTYDSLYRARQVFQVKTAIVATQTFHLQRALYIGDRLGLEVHGFRTDPRSYQSTTYMFIREAGARLKAVYETGRGVLPQRESPPMPIQGDGRQSRNPF